MDAVADLSDPALVARAQSGDLDAFEELVRRYQRGILRFCRGMLGNGPDAEDAVQDVLLTAWRRLPTLRATEAASTWLYRIASHRCIDALRKRRPDGGDPAEREAAQTGSEASRRLPAGPEGAAETRLALDALRGHLAALPDTQREAWTLREVQGMSYQDIARITGEPLATVRGRIARARTALAERMDSWK
jgi:RNA polymerase sigma-70 factor (ECF subfamily)